MLCELLFADEVYLLLNEVHIHAGHSHCFEVSFDDSICSYKVLSTKDVLQAHSETFEFVVVWKILEVGVWIFIDSVFVKICSLFRFNLVILSHVELHLDLRQQLDFLLHVIHLSYIDFLQFSWVRWSYSTSTSSAFPLSVPIIGSSSPKARSP